MVSMQRPLRSAPEPYGGRQRSGQNATAADRCPMIWLVLFPGFAIMLTVLAVNLVDDSFRDLLGPRMRGVR
jgi:hypothetical protein